MTRHWKRQGRSLAERLWEEHGAANALISGSQTPRESIPAVSNPPGLWYLVMASQRMNTRCEDRNQQMRAYCVPGTLLDVFASVFPCKPQSSQTMVTVPILQGHTARK